MNRYREGLRHGYRDMAQRVRDVLDSDLDNEAQLLELDRWCRTVLDDDSPTFGGAVVELPDDGDVHDPRD